MKKVVWILFALIIFWGCTGPTNLIKDPSFDKPIKIAILPFVNETTDLNAGELMRLFFFLGLEEKKFEVMDFDTTTKALQDLGITDGGQLGSYSMAELQKKLNVDGLLWANLLEAQYSTYGVMTKKSITLEIKIFQNGNQMWYDKETSKESGMGNLLNPLGGLIQQAVDKSLEKAFAKYKGHPLEAHIEAVAYKIQDKMPGERKIVSGWN